MILSEYSLDKLLKRKRYEDIQTVAKFQENLDAMLDSYEDFVKESVRLKVQCGRRFEYQNKYSVYLELGKRRFQGLVRPSAL